MAKYQLDNFTGECMHGKNVEFGNLIPGKLCFWREIYAILRENISFRCIFLSFSDKKFWKFVKKTFWLNFWPYSREILHLFPALGECFIIFSVRWTDYLHHLVTHNVSYSVSHFMNRWNLQHTFPTYSLWIGQIGSTPPSLKTLLLYASFARGSGRFVAVKLT